MNSAVYWGSVLQACSSHSAYTLFFLNILNVGFSGQAECFYFSADFSLQYSCIILELQLKKKEFIISFLRFVHLFFCCIL